VSFAPTAIENKQSKWQIVEQFIGDDDTCDLAMRELTDRYHIAWMHGALGCRYLDGRIAQSRQASRTRCKHRTCERPRSGACFYDIKLVGATELFPPLVKSTCNHSSKEWSDLRRREEIASTPRTSRILCNIETMFAIERESNKLVESN